MVYIYTIYSIFSLNISSRIRKETPTAVYHVQAIQFAETIKMLIDPSIF